MSGLARDGTAEYASRGQILRRKLGEGKTGVDRWLLKMRIEYFYLDQ